VTQDPFLLASKENEHETFRWLGSTDPGPPPLVVVSLKLMKQWPDFLPEEESQTSTNEPISVTLSLSRNLKK
jgi:hypothetical protein